MCWFYILKNEITNKYYTGSTVNLKERLKQHLRGNTRTTRVLKTYQLVYWEKFDKIVAARRREKQIKSFKSKKYIEWLILRARSSTPIKSGSTGRAGML